MRAIARRDLLGAAWMQAELPDIRSVPPDIATPAMTTGVPGPGIRVRQTLASWKGSEVYHALYLPTDWPTDGDANRRLPVIVEYAGNGNYRNQYGDVSAGVPEGSNLGYGISAGQGFVWICLPYVNAIERRNQILWWGDADATVEYCVEAVHMVCQQYGGDPFRVLLAGFSRGAIACNYLGLRNERVASLWCGFICYSHYDGVRHWPYSTANEREEALIRLGRLGGRPQFICHERSADPIREYLASTGVRGAFEIHDLPFRNHNDAWVLRDVPLRRSLRAWVRRVVS
jgi:hypothetical protein